MKIKLIKKTMALLLSASLVNGMCISSLAADNNASSETQETTSGQESTAQTPPGAAPGEKPDGQPPEMPNGEKPDGQPPEMPNGKKTDGQPPEMPNGQKPDGEPPAKPDGQMPDGPGQMGGGESGGQEKTDGQLGSWSMGGTDASSVEGDDYAYDSALYITSGGIDEEKSSTDRIEGGTYDDTAAQGVTIRDDVSGHNGILVDNAGYSITNAEIELLTDADGTDTCDFSGKGTAVAAFGSDAEVTIEDSFIHTSGVATMPVFADDGATLTIKTSTLQSDGGTISSDYLNTPSQGLMVTPPWILGIMGTSRCSNMMGNDTATNVIDSETSAGAWAVLSTDAGNDMYLNIYNTSLTLNNTDESEYLLQEEGGQISETLDNPYTENYGSGYGTYVIGNAVETFAGADMNVGTYATIFTGGTGIYTSLEEGQTYELKNSAGETTEEYTAEEDKVTTINSDTFGFMAHQNSNRIVIEKGTVVNTGYATFLIKSGSSNETLEASIDDAIITNGGVLIQVMDNDDATNGGMMDPDDELNTNGGSENFKPYHTEEGGFDTSEAQAGATAQTFTFTNGEYNGNIYNASGSDGLEGSELVVTLGEGAVLNGAAAQTSAIHVTYDGAVTVKENGGYAFDNADEAAAFAEEYQNTAFTINEYYSIGQVANLVNDNGVNKVSIELNADAVWNVTGTSLLSALAIEDGAQVIIPDNITLTVDGTEYSGCTLTAEDI
jgi:hypothetical protein